MSTTEKDLLARLQMQLANPKSEKSLLFGLSPGPDRTELLRNTVEQIELTAANEADFHEIRDIYAELLNRGLSNDLEKLTRDLAKLMSLVTLYVEKGSDIAGLREEVMLACFALIPPKPQWIKDHEAAVARGDWDASLDGLLAARAFNTNNKGAK